MRKDNIRDYATEAFRFYAACGRLTAAELEEKVRQEIYTKSKREFLHNGGPHLSSDATAYAVMQAEDAVAEMQAEFLDILAVERTLMQLDEAQRKAVEIVYFTKPDQELEKGEISRRVHQAEMEIPASTDTIFRWLRLARKTFAQARGLRILQK